MMIMIAAISATQMVVRRVPPSVNVRGPLVTWLHCDRITLKTISSANCVIAPTESESRIMGQAMIAATAMATSSSMSIVSFSIYITNYCGYNRQIPKLPS